MRQTNTVLKPQPYHRTPPRHRRTNIRQLPGRKRRQAPRLKQWVWDLVHGVLLMLPYYFIT